MKLIATEKGKPKINGSILFQVAYNGGKSIKAKIMNTIMPIIQ